MTTQRSSDDGRAQDRAAFFRTALLLGLVRGETVVAWADAEIGQSPAPHPVFIELATTPPDDVTAMRLALFGLSGEYPSIDVIHAVLGLIGQHLASGRRSVTDTVTVLSQLRGMVRLPADMVDDLRHIELENMRRARTGEIEALRARVTGWLEPYVGRDAMFLEN